MKRKRSFFHFFSRCAVLLILVSIALSAAGLSFAGGNTGNAEDFVMVCLNIGKADCILIKSASRAYLIDTGYEQTFPALTIMLDRYGVTRLDGVFLTHCHKDHEGGMQLLAESGIPVDAWYASEIFYDCKPNKHPALLAANSRGDEVSFLRAGDVIAAGENASFTVLGPLKCDQENENNNSLVMRFDCPFGSILLAGDMKENEENDLLSAGLLSPCDILKCGHHGDSGATCKAFLNAVRPKYAVISTASGEEADTPSPKVLQRLYAIGAEVTVTEECRDAVEFSLSSGGITVNDIAWDGIPPKAAGLAMRIDLAADTLTVFNTSSEDILIENAVLYSSKGTQIFSLGSVRIPAGSAVTVGGGASSGKFDIAVSSKKRIWHPDELDVAVLYDAWGRPLAWADNGKSD